MWSSMRVLLLYLCMAAILVLGDDYAQVQPEETCHHSKTVLVIGATGETGRHVVQMLLDQGHIVKVVVRNETKLRSMVMTTTTHHQEHLHVTTVPSVLDLSNETIQDLTHDCNVIVSCLGHTLSFQGIWGKPYCLVTETVQKFTYHAPANSKLILMASNGVTSNETRTTFELSMLWLLRQLVPPHADNEQAVDFLKHTTTPEWSVVRPGTLVNEEKVTNYSIHDHSPRGPFTDGTVSRINVAHWMVELILKDDVWQEYKYKLPVILNKEELQDSK